VLLRIEYRRELRCGRIEDVEAGLHGHDQAALGTHRERADIFRRGPLLISPARRIKAVNLAPLDIHPVQHTRLGVPQRTLAKQGSGVENAADVGHDRARS
jgi:hypothetical protein